MRRLPPFHRDDSRVETLWNRVTLGPAALDAGASG